MDSAEKDRLFRRLCDDGLGWCPKDDNGIRDWKDRLVANGVAEDEAVAEIRRAFTCGWTCRLRISPAGQAN